MRRSSKEDHPRVCGELLKYAKKTLTDSRSLNAQSTSEINLFSFGEFRNVWSRPRSWSEKSDPPSEDSLFLLWTHQPSSESGTSTSEFKEV